jgi:hypothetical protein
LPPGTEIREAILVAVTPEAELALGGQADLRLTHFPFKFGRESRASLGAFAREQRLGRAPQLNDVYLKEPASGLSQISRDHFAIERVEDHFFVVDRGSVTGTIVAERRIGGHRKGGRTALRVGDQITVGDERSPFIFRFTMAPEA